MSCILVQNDAENDEADRRHSVEPFKSPLHARFSELEERWSGIKQCSSMQRIDSSDSVTSATASVRRANIAIPDAPPATRRSKSELYTASSISTIPPYRDSVPPSSSSISLHSHQSKRSTSVSSSVFERLYSHGKAKVSAARRVEEVGTSWESKPNKRQSGNSAVRTPSDVSADHSHRSGGGSTISTLSSTSSTRRSLPENRRAPQPVQRAPSKPISASTSVASLDRGIRHPRAASDASRRCSDYSSVPNLSSPMEHLLGQSIDENSISASSNLSKDNVFHRLYRREKRPRASLLASYRGQTTPPPSIQAPTQKVNLEQDVDTTPIRRGGESRFTRHDGNTDAVRTTSHGATDENESFHSTTSDGMPSGSASDESLLVERTGGYDAGSIDAVDPADRMTDSKASNAVTLAECDVHTPRVFNDPLAFTPHMFANSPLAERAKTVRERHSAKKIQRAFRRNLVNASKGESRAKAATAIQKMWRWYLGERKLIDLMIVGWWMKCDFASSLDYNRVLIMKMGLESLKKVIRQIYGMEHVTALELESDRISIEWTREVVVEVEFQGAPVMEIVVVRLKCTARRPTFANHWSSEKTVSRVVRAALSKTVKRDQRKFFHVCAVIIQVWARKVAARQQLRASGFLRQVEATNSVIRATCLTPTSRERKAALRIQCAWRCHRAQIRASSLLLTSLRSECKLQRTSVCNAILQQRIRLLAVSKAIGQVDCWWLTEAIEIFADCIRVSWQREVGIHYEHQGSSQLESCVVHLTCQAARSSINATWDQRKMGIMLIKAALERVFARDRHSLQCSSIVMIQSWWRMIPRRRIFLASSNADREAKKFKQTHLSVQIQTLWRRYSHRNRYTALRASCITIQRMARKYNEGSAQARAARLIQHLWRESTVRSSFDDSSGHLLGFTLQRCQSTPTNLAAHQRLSRFQALARGCSVRTTYLRKKNAITTIQLFWRRFVAVCAFQKIKAGAVIIQSLARCSGQRIVFRRMQAKAVKIQACFRAHIVQKAFSTMRAGIVIIQSQVRRLLSQSQLRHRRTAALIIKDSWLQYRVRKQIQNGQQHVALQGCAVMIQAKFRARRTRNAYIQQQDSAVLAQRVWRGSQAQSRLRIAVAAVLRIQSVWRQHNAKLQRAKEHAEMVALATLVQAKVRAHLHRGAFRRQKGSAELAQRVWRGGLTRRRFRTEMVAARRIQTAWRRHREHQQSQLAMQQLALDALVTRIQAQFRARRPRTAYIHQQDSAVLAQRVLRGSQARSRLRMAVAAIRRIQSVWRQHHAQLQRAKEHAEMVALATLIQAQVRAHLYRGAFLQQKGSAVLVQHVWRGCRIRRRLRTEMVAARRIQTAWRRRCEHQQSQRAMQQLALDALVTRIQAQFRARRTRNAHIHQQDSAVLAQRVWRSSQARRRLRMAVAAVLRIQSVWRQHHAQLQRAKEHAEMVALATLIQAQVRAHLYRGAFRQQKASAVLVQRVWRGCRTRRRLRTEMVAARRIQTAWRRHREHQRSQRAIQQLALDVLITLIQAQFRAHRTRNAYIHQQDKAILAQRVWRGSKSRSRLRMAVAAVRRIQFVWRQHHAKLQRAKEHAEMVALATLIQAQVRAHLHRGAFRQQKGSAVLAQRVWRGSLTRSRFRTEMVAARRIQTAWRRRCEHQQSQRAMQQLALDALVTRIQAQFRARRTRNAYIHQQDSAVLTQRVWRGSQARRRLRMAVAAVRRIQFVWRQHHAKLQRAKEHAEMVALATLIQAQVRAHLHRGAFRRQKGSAVLAQRVWRWSLTRRRFRTEMVAARRIQTAWRRHCEHQRSQRAMQQLALNALVTLIQAQFRARRTRNAYIHQQDSAVLAQRVWRSSQARSRLRMAVAAVRRIQSVWRQHHAKLQRAKEHAEMVALATLIQAQVRAHLHRSAFLQQKGSAVFAQRLWRSVLARNEMRSLSAIAIQRNWRRFCCESQYFAVLLGVLAIQTWFRQILLARRVVRGVRLLQAASRGARSRSTLLAMRKSADTIQRSWRCHCAKMSQRRTFSATRIQAFARSRLTRMYITRYLSMTIRVQALLRRFLVKLEIARMTSSAKSIQCFWRALILRSRFLDVRSSATVCQKWARMALARKVFVNERRAAIVMQYYWRRLVYKRAQQVVFRHAVFIQKTTRSRLARQSYLNARRGICLLQALARGSLQRSLAKDWRASFNAAVSIQSIARRKFERDNFVNLRNAAIRIQNHRRLRKACMLMTVKRRQDMALASFQAIVRAKLAGSLFAQQKGAARVIQAAFFAWKMNLTLLEVQSSVVLLKRSIRGQLERSATRFALSHVNDSRRSFERMSKTSFHFDSSKLFAWSEAESMAKECAAVVIQGSIRRLIAIVRTREVFGKALCPERESKIGSRWRIILLRQDENATIIQARFRAFQKRQEPKNYRAAAMLLQASYRCHFHTRKFFRTKTAIIKLQYIFRMRHSRTISAAHNIAATQIQASVRGYQSRTHYRSAIESVRVIQSYWRQWVDATRKSQELVSAIRIQKWTKAIKRRWMERRELALATERKIRFVERAILLEMERNARDQVGLLLLKTRRVRPTSACVRRLAKRVKSLSQDCKENHTHGKCNNSGLFTVYEQCNYTNTPN